MKGLGKKASFAFPFTHTPSPVLASLCLFLCHATPALCDREREKPELDYHTPDYLTRVTRPNWLARTEMVVAQAAIQ